MSKATLQNLFVVLILIFTTSSCTSNKEVALTCEGRDWYEIGRQSGVLGNGPETFEKVSRQCPAENIPVFLKPYLQGHSAGITEYCSPDNGFFIGKMGENPKTICPEILERRFLLWHLRGKKAYKLEVANEGLSGQISEILQQLKIPGSNIGEEKKLQSKLEKLESSLKKNENEISNLKKRL